jgi:hypothetical protein
LRAAPSVTITLTARAKVTFSVVRRRTGVRVGKSCLAPGHGRHGKACTRTTTVAETTARSLAKGTSTLRFSARVGGHALRPGTHALRATPAHGKARRTNFPHRALSGGALLTDGRGPGR